MIVEDAEWLDVPSLEVLGFVARRLEHEPVIVLFAVREGIPSAVDESGLPELHLGGLDDDAAKALLELTAPDLPAHLKGRILEQAAGNPLALLELPAAAASLDGADPAGALPLPTRLEQAFAAKLAGLDSDTRRWLLLAALEDGELPGLAREPAWEPAESAGLGFIDQGTFRFRHPLIRSAVAQAATPLQRRQAHAELAKALEHEPDRAVWHRAAAAGAGPDEQVAQDLVAAAERARLRGSREFALAALEQAAELSGDPSARALRLFHAGELASELGRPTDSARLLRAAQKLGLPPQQRALASFYVEVLEPTWSGAATVRSFARIAQELAEAGHDDQALQTLDAIALRAHWENLDRETRGHVAAITQQLAGAPDDPARLETLALFDPVGQGAEVLRRVRRMAPLDVPDAGGAVRGRLGCGRRVGPQPGAPVPPGCLRRLPRRRTARAACADARVRGLGRGPRRCGARRDHRSSRGCAAGAGDAAGPVRRRRTARAGDRSRRDGRGRGRRAAHSDGRGHAPAARGEPAPLAGRLGTRPAGARARALRRGLRAPASDLRPERRGVPAVRGGWVLADLADATLQGDGDREVVAGLLRRVASGRHSHRCAAAGRPAAVREGGPRRRRERPSRSTRARSAPARTAGPSMPRARSSPTAPGSGGSTA